MRICIRPSMPDSPAILSLINATGDHKAMYYVVNLFCWAARHCPSGDLAEQGVHSGMVEDICGWTKEHPDEPGAFYDCLVQQGAFLEEAKEEGNVIVSLRIPMWDQVLEAE